MPNPKRHTAQNALTLERLRELLEYNPATGDFTWKAARENSVRSGRVAGWVSVKGYKIVEIDRKQFPAHRLAWFYVHGGFPSGQVDHINGLRTDNRLANLRIVSNSVNQQNKRRARSDSKTGILGVHLHRPGKWQAKINVGGRKKSLGMFDSPTAAEAAYLDAKRRMHAGCVI